MYLHIYGPTLCRLRDWKISYFVSVKTAQRVSLLVLDPACNLAIKKKTTLCIYVQVVFFGFDDFEAVDK